MTGRTHLTLGAAAGLLIAHLTGADPIHCIAAGAIGGLLPDIDHPRSILSGWIPGMGLLLKLGRVGHRGFTHSLLAITILMPVAMNLLPAGIARALIAGAASHLIVDMLTPMGIPLFYPVKRHCRFAPAPVLKGFMWFGLDGLLWIGAIAILIRTGLSYAAIF